MITEPALLFENGLAYDGCVESIQLLSDSLSYAPMNNTLPLVEKAIGNIPSDANSLARSVMIRYSKTGNQITIGCGWSNSLSAGKLEVFDIVKR